MQTIVGVLRGGPSREHDTSLKTGATMLAHLLPERYTTRDIYVDRRGQWHDRGRVTTPERALRQIDVALIGMHGTYGEDGEIQRVLGRFGVPYAGSDSFGSYLAMHKLMAKMRAREAGLATPDFRYVGRAEDSEAIVHEVIRAFPQPVVVKSVDWGSSIGVSVVGGYAHVLSAIQGLFTAGAQGVLVEEYLRGKEATVSVVERMRGEVLYTFPPIEIISTNEAHFSHEAKMTGGGRRNCPGSFSRVASEDLQLAARAMHRALGLRHYSQSDFIVTPKGVYYLETDALPALTRDSLLSQSLSSVGIAHPEFFSHLVSLALSR